MVHNDEDEAHYLTSERIYEYLKAKEGELLGVEEDRELGEDEEDLEDYEDDNDESGVEEISKEEFKDRKRLNLGNGEESLTGKP